MVGSVGNGSTLRLISDIPGVKYTEGRFLPYFFPDTFHEGGDPVREAKENWVTARRAILRKPIDRIGYGGYLKLACEFPEFIDYVESVCDEFRELYDNIKGTTPYCVKTVAVLNCWGKMRAWGCHMVHHALYQKQNYSYAGVIEALSGAPFDVRFISFDDMQARTPMLLDGVDVLINVGDGDTAHTGGGVWEDPAVAAAVRRLRLQRRRLHRRGRALRPPVPGPLSAAGRRAGRGEGDGLHAGLRQVQLGGASRPLHPGGLHEAGGFRRGQKGHLRPAGHARSWCSGKRRCRWPCNAFGKGRAVYISGLPYSFENSRVLYRAILWAAHDEESLHKWFSSNFNVEVHAYVKNGKYCVVNNTYEPQSTAVYKGDGSSFALDMAANEIKWYEI